MIRNGRINFNVLERQSVDLDLNQQDSWVVKMLERAAPVPEWVDMAPEEWAKASLFDSQLRIERLAGGDEYSVKGSLKASVPALCARCGVRFQAPREAEFQVYIQRVDAKASDDSGDPDLLYVKGADLDLNEILAEHLVAAEPYAEPCPDCAQKAETIEFGAGQDPLKEANSPFSKLAVLKKGES
jgi:uncharacterized metal-binding protein YceD (DUF177 family)